VKASRRAILAAGAAAPAVALGAAPAVGANPDAALIRMVDDFIARHIAADAAADPLNEKPMRDWTAEDRAVWEASCAWNTGYHETMAEIAAAVPTTVEGLAAQALAVVYHLRFEGDGGYDAALPLVVAHGVLVLAGRPLPTWAVAAVKAAREAQDAEAA
jgi:hypothetical protein